MPRLTAKKLHQKGFELREKDPKLVIRKGQIKKLGEIFLVWFGCPIIIIPVSMVFYLVW